MEIIGLLKIDNYKIIYSKIYFKNVQGYLNFFIKFGLVIFDLGKFELEK